MEFTVGVCKEGVIRRTKGGRGWGFILKGKKQEYCFSVFCVKIN
jgi:hypothetical protein